MQIYEFHTQATNDYNRKFYKRKRKFVSIPLLRFHDKTGETRLFEMKINISTFILRNITYDVVLDTPKAQFEIIITRYIILFN